MKSCFILLFFITSHLLISQGANDYSVVFFKEVTIESEIFKMEIINSFSKEDIIRIKVRILNKSKDYLVIKPDEIFFKTAKKEYRGEEKFILVKPSEEVYKFVTARDTAIKTTAVDLHVNGIYILPYGDEVTEAPQVKLPVPRRTPFKMGNYECVINDVDLENDVSIVKVACVYTGDKIGILEPGKVVAIMPTGIENLNYNTGKTPVLLEKQEEEKFKLVFESLKGGGKMRQGITLDWKNCFRASVLVPVKGFLAEMRIDPGRSEK
jgi:hypothetical protein